MSYTVGVLFLPLFLPHDILGVRGEKALLFGVWVAYLVRHQTGRIQWGEVFQMGYALPVTVLALALIPFFDTFLRWLYGTAAWWSFPV